MSEDMVDGDADCIIEFLEADLETQKTPVLEEEIKRDASRLFSYPPSIDSDGNDLGPRTNGRSGALISWLEENPDAFDPGKIDGPDNE